ncbi:hypothetical protein J4218_00575 [Candidatus Pacearchaeota archaeon]|nr:hypothetical protein [Candidatus Pacearchaeota archaeon]
MLTLLDRLRPIPRGTMRVVAVDPTKLDQLPKIQVLIDKTQFQGIETRGFETRCGNERYSIVLSTVEKTFDGDGYQLDVYDNQKQSDPTIPGSRSTPEHLVSRKIYGDREKVIDRFTAARAYFLQEERK